MYMGSRHPQQMVENVVKALRVLGVLSSVAPVVGIPLVFRLVSLRQRLENFPSRRSADAGGVIPGVMIGACAGQAPSSDLLRPSG